MRAFAKFVALPFFSGCASRSTVATGTPVSTTEGRELNGSDVNPSVASKINGFLFSSLLLFPNSFVCSFNQTGFRFKVLYVVICYC